MSIQSTPARSRRELLAAGVGVLVGTVAAALGRPATALAVDGDPVLAGATTAAGNTTAIEATTGDGLRAQTGAAGSVGARAVNTAGGTAMLAVSGTDSVTPAAKIGVYAYANQDANARAVYGKSLLGTGVWGNSDSGRGLFGRSTAGTGVSAQSDTGRAVYGTSAAVAGRAAIVGQNTSGQGAGVQGFVGSSTAPTPDGGTGVQGVSATAGKGVHGRSALGNGVVGDSTSGIGVYGVSTSGPGVKGVSNSQLVAAVVGESHGESAGVEGWSGFTTGSAPMPPPQTGVFGSSNLSGGSIGVAGRTLLGAGVQGISGSPVGATSDYSRTGVYGYSPTSTDTIVATGVWGDTGDGFGVLGTAGNIGVVGSGGGLGVFGVSGATGAGIVGFAGAGGVPAVPDGTGIMAAAEGTNSALDVRGVARFSRSGKTSLSSGSSRVVTNVALTSSSLVLALLQTNRSGVWVRAVTPNVAGSSFTIYLNTAVSAATNIAWFVIG